MAIGTPTTPILVVGGASADSFNTGSYVPPADCVLVAFVTSRGADGTEPTISDTGATWSAVTGSYAAASGARGKLFYLDVGGSPPTLDTTGTSTGATQTAIEIVDFPGGEVNLSNVRTGTSTTGDPSISSNFDAFQTGAACVGFAGVSGGDARTPPTGYTELNDSLPATNLRTHAWYDLTDPAVAMGISGAGVSAVICGVEIVEASGAGTDALLADDVATGAPTVGSPVIGQIHALGANDVATAAPSVGSPVLGQVHALTADDVATGVPTVSAPVLAEADEEEPLIEQPAPQPSGGGGGYAYRPSDDDVQKILRVLTRKRKKKKKITEQQVVNAVFGLMPAGLGVAREIVRQQAALVAAYVPDQTDTAAIISAIERMLTVARQAEEDADEDDIEWLLLAA